MNLPILSSQEDNSESKRVDFLINLVSIFFLYNSKTSKLLFNEWRRLQNISMQSLARALK